LEYEILKFDKNDAAACLSARDDNSHKGNFGYIALIGGSVRYSGAIKLANLASCAMRSGAGVVTIAAPEQICDAIMPQILESTLIPLSSESGYIKFVPKEFDEIIQRYDVIAFGMGIGNNEETKKAIQYLLKNYKGVLIVDADGINAMAQLPKEEVAGHSCRLIITPHLKEFSTLSGVPMENLNDNKEEAAAKLALAINAIVLLKGHCTLVTNGSKAYAVEKGCAGMATAGSGDVLSGITASICASNKDNLLKAVAAGAYINGLAGELAEKENGQISMIASDTAGKVAMAINQIISN